MIAGSLLALALASPAGAVAGAVPAFDRLQAFWAGIQDYSMTIDAHEVLGDASGEAELHYAFKRPDRARLDVIKGAHSGSTVVWDGGERVTAYKRVFSLFKIHPDVHDDRITSLRGNGIQTGNLGDVVACFAAHRDATLMRAPRLLKALPEHLLLLMLMKSTKGADGDLRRLHSSSISKSG